MSATPETWRSMDTAPKDGTAILTFVPETNEHGQAIVIAYYGKNNHVSLYSWVYQSGPLGDEEIESCEPTHWMPLPPPPRDSGASE